jgi:phosphoglycerate dehydrogenase-like enzyme
VYDPYLDRDEARALGVESVDLPTLLGRSDVVSLHAPLLAETRQLLGAREFALMRDGATFINTARGAIVDQEALVRELVRGRINGVLDTTEPEVLPPESPLYRLPNVFLTPHIAGSLGSEVERLADHIVDEVERFVAGTGLRYGVPFEALPRLA